MWVMAGASSSAAASLLSAQLPGPGLEVGTNGGFDGPGGERALLEQTVPKRAEAALYAIVLDGDAHDRSGQPAELDLETVKEVYKATQTVHAALKVEQFEALKAAGLTYLHAAFGFALVDHLGYPSRLGKDASFVQIGKNVERQMKRGAKAFPGCSRAALELLCCSAPAAATPAAAGAAAAASPISAASERTPVPQREHTMPVEAYEAVIELTGQLAEVTGDLDECTQLALSLHDQLAAEVTRRKLAEAAEAAACKRADACEREANKLAKAAIKEAREEFDKKIGLALEQQGIAEREAVHLRREPAALRSEMLKLEAAHDKALAEQVTESARQSARQLARECKEIKALTRERDDLEVKFADACAKLLVAKDKASAATTAAEAATRDAKQATRQLASEAGRAALAERKLGRAEAGRALAAERTRKLALQLAALGRMRGADAQAELTRLGREVSSLGAQLEKATAIGSKRAREATEAYRRERLALRTADSAQRKRHRGLAAEKPSYSVDEVIDDDLAAAHAALDAARRAHEADLADWQGERTRFELEAANLRAIAEPSAEVQQE
mmetsp:Transcript_36830/g.91694  ORF Transcript_36830/g.91694 Transcript_36830/m.91694 type:complete len:562 (-) Transcript_36830:422-2107(-)